MPTVISVENLSKAYRLGQIGTGTFTNDLKLWWAKARGVPNPLLKIGESDHGNRDGEDLWALRDVSFTVEQGEVLGIIGRNGAGKSTLLKILSRVTAPTSGKIKVKGRVASLLEVGTGFHPELTGRENIYLNGAILGMKRGEITRKFDEIVDFAEVEKFIDTPVKRYSSGMYVRLAFAVAAHLEPEILVVDEVLAVGDAEFQKKCLGKMGDVAKEGRTVLFVSHNMAAIAGLSNEVLVVNSGRLHYRGTPGDAIGNYLNSLTNSEQQTTIDLKCVPRKGNGPLRFTGISIQNSTQEKVQHLVSGDCVDFVLDYESHGETSPLKNVGVSMIIYSYDGVRIANLWNEYEQAKPFREIPPKGAIRCQLTRLPLRSGKYYVELYSTVNNTVSDWIHEAMSFTVADGDYFGSGKISLYSNGYVFLDHHWKAEDLDATK